MCGGLCVRMDPFEGGVMALRCCSVVHYALCLAWVCDGICHGPCALQDWQERRDMMAPMARMTLQWRLFPRAQPEAHALLHGLDRECVWMCPHMTLCMGRALLH